MKVGPELKNPAPTASATKRKSHCVFHSFPLRLPTPTPNPDESTGNGKNVRNTLSLSLSPFVWSGAFRVFRSRFRFGTAERKRNRQRNLERKPEQNRTPAAKRKTEKRKMKCAWLPQRALQVYRHGLTSFSRFRPIAVPDGRPEGNDGT